MSRARKKTLLLLQSVCKTFFIFSCMTIFVKSAGAQILPEQFPDGFKVTKPMEYYDPGNLYDLINGQAVFYLSYGFVKLDHAYYEKDGVSYRVDVYELADRLSALGSYRQQKDEDTSELNIGTEGYIIDYLAAFFKDKYYVEIVPMDDGDITELKLLAGHVEKSVPGTRELPPELSLFPQDGLIPNSEMYFGESFLSYSFMGNGLSAYYMQKQDDKEIRVFIALSDSKEKAQKISEDFKEKLNNIKSIKLFENVSGTSGEMAYRGKTMIFHYKYYAFGCLGYTNDGEASDILGKLLENLKSYTDVSK